MSANDGDLVDRLAKKHSVSPAAVQGPLSGATRKHLLALRSSQFDPGADIVPTRAGQD
jgi:hypothetical protein